MQIAVRIHCSFSISFTHTLSFPFPSFLVPSSNHCHDSLLFLLSFVTHTLSLLFLSFAFPNLLSRFTTLPSFSTRTLSSPFSPFLSLSFPSPLLNLRARNYLFISLSSLTPFPPSSCHTLSSQRFPFLSFPLFIAPSLSTGNISVYYLLLHPSSSLTPSSLWCPSEVECP